MSRVRTRVVVISLLSACAIVSAGALLVWLTAPVPAPASSTTRAVQTVPAAVKPLVSQVKAPGSIDFQRASKMTAGIEGVLTQVPAPGTIVSQGETLFRVDDAPVVLMYGETPMWRPFERGMSRGPDVQQLEQNLADLGFFFGVVDEVHDWDTTAAVLAWQRALGLEADGTIPQGRVRFATEPVRVGTAETAKGMPLTGDETVYKASSAVPAIRAEVPANERDQIHEEMPVEIGLPDGSTATGKVAAIDAVKETEDASERKKLVLPVTVAPDDPDAMVPLVPATAQLVFTSTSEDSVLQVPVSALIAIEADELGVEVRRGEEYARVPVRTGRYAGGAVEILEGLKEGEKVVVPS